MWRLPRRISDRTYAKEGQSLQWNVLLLHVELDAFVCDEGLLRKADDALSVACEVIVGCLEICINIVIVPSSRVVSRNTVRRMHGARGRRW